MRFGKSAPMSSPDLAQATHEGPNCPWECEK